MSDAKNAQRSLLDSITRRRLLQATGLSNKHGAFVKDRPVRPQDLGATVCHSLGVPLDTRLGRDGFTRPLSTGEPLLDLFGWRTDPAMRNPTSEAAA